MTNEESAAKAADEIWSNLTDRSGVGNALESCDDDIQVEIRREMADIIYDAIVLSKEALRG